VVLLLLPLPVAVLHAWLVFKTDFEPIPTSETFALESVSTEGALAIGDSALWLDLRPGTERASTRLPAGAQFQSVWDGSTPVTNQIAELKRTHGLTHVIIVGLPHEGRTAADRLRTALESEGWVVLKLQPGEHL
jgi:hypothetical protein